MEEMAQYNGFDADAKEFKKLASDLKKKIRTNLWCEDKGRYIAGIAYNEDGYEDIDYDWENIGFDYIWALTLAEDEHLPFDKKAQQLCLGASFPFKQWRNMDKENQKSHLWTPNRDRAWIGANFGQAEVATDFPDFRKELLNDLIRDACTIDHHHDAGYYFSYCLSEGKSNYNLPQIFAIAPALKALCLTVQK